ncbi:LysM peptidoglycan-binding domain-containing protein [Acidovorax sp. 1608163]|uniref:LysM peptidoglycan-binding domain-containing protein n=1 Tax=Acidovorax sp. 1608163 TaxID=2478662 RepID=UPI000EF72A49|nr:LysM peptidoglycan-binding domain-containing protein [Acidovorax sp. 1608163]AYM96375.1 LysM peptidoglycan-binding domain-containing protein [Acidovorax sp. 1608163]
MVAIVSGNSLGLSTSSLSTLAQRGIFGNAAQGRNGEQTFVNIATGNLVLSDSDDRLMAHGGGFEAVRTYNSQGLLNDDNGDNWSAGVYRQQLTLSGTVNTAGSTVTRIARDGAVSVYEWNAAASAYVSKDGAGAYDQIKAQGSGFIWADGASQAQETYDAATGQLRSSKDSSGNVTTYAYHPSGNLASVTTASGETTYYDYSGNNLTQVRSVTSDGKTTTRVRYTYDTSNRLSTVQVDLSPADNVVSDAKVYTTTYTYDGTSKRIASITQSDGTSLSFTYVQAGGQYRVATVRDALNQTTTFAYDLATRTTTVTDPLGLKTTYVYDAAGQLTSVNSPSVKGVVLTTSYLYNANGDVIQVTDAEGKSVSMEYDASGNQVLQRDAVGNTVRRTFSSSNRLLTETTYTVADPDGAGSGVPQGPTTARYVYDTANPNLMRFSISAEGRVTEYRYNAYGERTVALQFAQNSFYPVSALAPDETPTLDAMTTWSGQQDLTTLSRVDYQYDARGQLTESAAAQKTTSTGVTDTTGQIVRQTYIYSQTGQLLSTIQQTSSGNAITTYTYDGMGRLLSTTNALGQTTVNTYDDAGNRTTIVAANGLRTIQTYNKAGQLISVQQATATVADLGKTQYFYDADGQLRMTQGPTGERNWTLLDEAGRKVADIDPTGTLTEYVYNKQGLLTRTIRYAAAVNTATLVNASGQPSNPTLDSIRPATNAADRSEWRAYDDSGRLLKTVDALGSVAEYTYDGKSQLLSIRQYANRVAVASLGNTPTAASIAPAANNATDRLTRNFYDADGLLQGSLDAEGYLTEHRYTSAGLRYITVRYSTGVATASLGGTTLASLRPATTDKDVVTVKIFDGTGQVQAEIDAEGYVTTFKYSAAGLLIESKRFATKLSQSAINLAQSQPVSISQLVLPASSSQDQTTLTSYDALNRIAASTDYLGTRTEYSYDEVGNLIKTTRAAGTTEASSLAKKYDAQGRLVAELSATGYALITASMTTAQINDVWAKYGNTHAYDLSGRRTSTTNAVGNKTLFFYDRDGRLSHTINALGEVTETQYNNFGQVSATIAYSKRIALTSLTGANAGGLVNATLTSLLTAARTPASDKVTSYTYDVVGNLVQTTDALGFQRNYVYSTFRQETQRTEAISSTSSTTTLTGYDRRGLLVNQTRDSTGLAATFSYQYDAFGNQIGWVDAKGFTRQKTFDRLGREVRSLNAQSAATETTYDAFNRVIRQYDAVGNTTTYVYDAATNSVTISSDDGILLKKTFNRLGDTISITDARGSVTSYTYNADGQETGSAVEVWHFDTNGVEIVRTANAYDGAGRLIESTNPNGVRTKVTYDAANRVLTRSVDSAGLNLTTTYAYDALGRQISITSPEGSVIELKYDAQGQLIEQIVDAKGLALSTRYTYDGLGQTLQVTSPQGTVTRYTYDTAGRRISEQIDPDGLNLTRSYVYDKNNNVVRSTDANGNVSFYFYDQENRQILSIDGAGSIKEIAYDLIGRVSKTTQYRQVFTDANLLQQYASGGAVFGPSGWESQVRSKIVASANDQIEYRTYDANNHLQSIVTGLGEVTLFVRDGNGNVLEQRRFYNSIQVGGAGGWMPGTLPQPVRDELFDQWTRSAYDSLGRVAATINSVGAATKLSYDAAGNLTQRVSYAKPVKISSYPTDASFIAELAAQDGAAENIVTKNIYDAANRLTWTADGTRAVTHLRYDRDGHVVKKVRFATAISTSSTPQSATQSTNDQITDYVYDKAGRLTYTVEANGATTRNIYDRNGNLKQRVEYATAITPPIFKPGAVFGPSDPSNYYESSIGSYIKTSPSDRTSTWAYDKGNRQVLEVDATGGVRQTFYGKLQSTKSSGALAGANAVTVVAYANAVSLTGLAAADITVDAILARLQTNADLDRATIQVLDGANRVATTVDAAGYAISNDYDGTGQLIHTVQYGQAGGAASALDRHAFYVYDGAARLTERTDALGHKESYTYDALGNKTSFTNPLGAVWTYAYDQAGRMVREISPMVEVVNQSQGGLGATAASSYSQTQISRIVTELKYDTLGNLISRIEASGLPEQRTTEYRYDLAGRQIRTIFPAVGVYAPESKEALLANGQSGAASRSESQPQSLYSETLYDTLGNAIAGRDVSGNWSYKAYDRLGRVSYEIDAVGYVTSYTRNRWGDAEGLVRYAEPSTLTLSNPSTGFKASDIATHMSAKSHVADRDLIMSYDKMGRLLQTQEPLVFNYDSQTGEQSTGRKTTTNSYNAFGDLIAVSSIQGSSRWAFTSHEYNKLGQRIATVDPAGYLTTMSYDMAGNLLKKVEFAQAQGVARPEADTAKGDRVTEYQWDNLNRKTAEIKKGVLYSEVDGTAAAVKDSRGDLTTSYKYDAVGNLLLTTDAAGGKTYSYYDALGRVTSVIAPQIAGQGGAWTEFKRDAYGNALLTIERASGVSVLPDGWAIKLGLGASRYTATRFDASGKAIQVMDAMNNSRFFSYDAAGRLAKEWQTVTVKNANGSSGQETLWTAYAYDNLGRQISQTKPVQRSMDTSVQLAGKTSFVYNAFGELREKSVTESAASTPDANATLIHKETYEYDNAGRVWRTNAGDGVYKVLAYNVEGQQTSQILATGATGLQTYASTQATLAAQAGSPALFSRSDMRYDKLGRLTQTLEPERVNEKAMSVTTRQNMLYGVITKSSVVDGKLNRGLNQVDLVWRSLEDLGSGDVRITLVYDTAKYTTEENRDDQFIGEHPASYGLKRSVIASAEEAKTGYVFKWDDTFANQYYGIGKIQRIQVEKMDVFGKWASLYDVAPSEQVTALNWSQATSPGYIWSEAADGRSPIYRLYNRYSAAHFLSTDVTERDRLLNQGNGWLDEGTAGYVNSTQSAGLVPLYRLQLVGSDVTIYTANITEAQKLQAGNSTLAPGKWVYKRIDGYVVDPATTKVPEGAVKFWGLQRNTSSTVVGSILYTTSQSDVNALLGLTPVPVGQTNTKPMQLYSAALGLSIEVSYPQNLVSKTYLSFRRYGSNGEWTTPAAEKFQQAFGSAHRFDLSKLGLDPGGYEYRITNVEDGSSATREVGNGTFTIYGTGSPDTDSYAPIPSGVSQGSAVIDTQPYRVLQWAKPTADWTVKFRYKTSGSTAAWTERAVGTGVFAYGDGRTSGLGAGMQGVALNFGAGAFDYEVIFENAKTGEKLRSTGNVLQPTDLALVNTTPAIVKTQNNVINNGIVGYVWTTPAPGRVPLYRYYLVYQGLDHHITTADPTVIAEMEGMIASGAVVRDGIVGYVETTQTANNGRLYQYIYGGKNIFRLTANFADIGSAVILKEKPAANMVWSDRWYQNAYQLDGYISYVPIEGTVPLYAIYDGNSKGNLTIGDYLTSASEYEVTQYDMLRAGTAATANVPGVALSKAMIDGQTLNVLQWSTPAVGARVKVSVTPAMPDGNTTPFIFKQGDGRSQFAKSAALQGFSLETLRPGETYKVQIEIEYPGASSQKPYTARTDVTITIPLSGAGSALIQKDTTAPFTPQIRVFAAPAINLTNRAVTNREYDRWGNLTMVDDPRTQTDGLRYKTTYEYNANNQLISQSKPLNFNNVNPATTRYYYDQLGRQIGVRDGVGTGAGETGNLNVQVYDAAGNVVEERHADGGRISYVYNMFGDKISSKQLVNSSREVVTNYQYDQLSRLVNASLEKAQTRWSVVSLDKDVSRGALDTSQALDKQHLQNGAELTYESYTLLEQNEYDEAGRKVRVINGNGEATRYQYDKSGNVITSGQEVPSSTGPATLAYTVQYRYDSAGRKIAQQDANGATSAQTWSYNTTGQLTGRTDGAVTYSYSFTNAGKLLQTRASNGQSLDYQYDGAGQLIRIQDNYLGQTSTYTYDLAGNRITERVTQKTTLTNGEVANVVYQDNKLFYDGQNRLYAAFDGRADVRIKYDRSGNRSSVETRVLTQVADKNQPTGMKETLNESIVSYTYDSMNRQLSSRSVSKTGDTLEWHTYRYDLAGNRVEEQSAVKNTDSTGGPFKGGTTLYTYDDLHRLDMQMVGGPDQVYRYYYDGAGRTVATQSVLYAREGNFNEYRYNQFDATGHLQNSKMVSRDPNNRTVRSYSSVAYHNTGSTTGLGYDAAGNLLGYRQVGDDGKGSVTTYTYKRVNGGYVQDTATTLKDGQRPEEAAKTQTWYDANGFISNIVQPSASDSATQVDYSKRFNRAFVNDTQGNVLYVNQGASQTSRIENKAGGYIGGWVGDSLNPGNIQRQMVVGGEVLARYGSAPDSEKPLTANNAAPNYVNTAEFYVGASPMPIKGGSTSPVSYTVVGGESLKDIARSVLGDAGLWWRIAEANSLAVSADAPLIAGQTLTVPKVPLSANSADTLRPYEPGKVIGSQDPVLPEPAAAGGKKGCGGIGKVLMAVVAVVVAVYAPYLLQNILPNMIGASGVTAAGAAVGAAAGSAASQLVGIAIGEQDSFSWKAVGLAALSGGISAGLAGTELLGGTNLGTTIARAATANALTQGIGVMTGLQKSFDWKGVAGAAVGAGVGWGLNEALGVTVDGKTNVNANASNQAFFGMGAAGAVLRGTLSGLGRGRLPLLQEVARWRSSKSRRMRLATLWAAA